MSFKYLVKVKSLNIIEDEKTQEEIITHADFFGDEDDYTIIYAEDRNGLSQETTIRVTKGEFITIQRKAEIETYMVIETGIRHLSEHKLPFGSFSLGVIGSYIKSDFCENGVNLSFKYTTDTDMQPLGCAVFDLTVRRKGSIPGNF